MRSGEAALFWKTEHGPLRRAEPCRRRWRRSSWDGHAGARSRIDRPSLWKEGDEPARGDEGGRARDRRVGNSMRWRWHWHARPGECRRRASRCRAGGRHREAGLSGASAFTKERTFHAEADPVTVVCGTRRGDAFGGALSARGSIGNGTSGARSRSANAAGAIVGIGLACAAPMPDDLRGQRPLGDVTPVSGTTRLTMAQASHSFLSSQYVERDGKRIVLPRRVRDLGHGNVAGIGQALYQYRDRMPYRFSAANEQAMVHIAAAYARMRDRLGTFACTSSIGPGATKHGHRCGARDHRPASGAAPAGATSSPRAVRIRCWQQLEVPSRANVSVNDAFIPVSRYFDPSCARADRAAALAAMRVLTSPAETGRRHAVAAADVQTEAFDVPTSSSASACGTSAVPSPTRSAARAACGGHRRRAASAHRCGRRPSPMHARTRRCPLVERTGIPVSETQAGKGSLPSITRSRRRDRGHRHERRERARARGRPHHRHRHALDRLHDGMQRCSGPTRGSLA